MEQVWLAWPPGARTGPADLGMLRVTCHLPLKLWCSMFSFLWERTVLFVQGLMAKIGIPPPNFIMSKDYSHMKPARTDSSGWPWGRGGSLAPAFKTVRDCAFLPIERNNFHVQGSMAKIGNPPPKCCLSKDSSQTKAARNI